MMFAVEHRSPHGPWRRAEELVPNPRYEWTWYDADGVEQSFPSLEAALVHDTWSFYMSDRWLHDINWPEQQPVPVDVTQETTEFLEAWTESEGRHTLTLRYLEELDWVQACVKGPSLASTPEDRERYILQVREDVLGRLRPLGAPDDVRLIYGWNI